MSRRRFFLQTNYKRWIILALLVVGLAGCFGSGGGGGSTAKGTKGCSGDCATATPQFLSIADVQRIISQAVLEAQARGVVGTIAVSDRVGNILAVFRMNGADTTITITSTFEQGAPIIGGLEGINIIPDTMVAIAKAVTGAFLSTEGNAFTTRTASQIVQEHFNPGEFNRPGGPLFGVQFSQLPCSDLNLRFTLDDIAASRPGPKRSPLGFSADPGGLPLYKNGTPVGGIGVITDSIYGLDKDITGALDVDIDELVALAGTIGFEAPTSRRADQITVDGKTLRFSDASRGQLLANAADAPNFAAIKDVIGRLVGVAGYFNGGSADLGAAGDAARAVLAGTAFGTAASGIRADALDFADSLDAFVLVDATNTERYRPMAGTDTPGGNAANALTALEVRQLLSSALGVANEARAQIRRPLGSQARVSISVVDTNGAILGIVRGRDAPVFGIDVSLQKARTATFFSGTGTAADPASAVRAAPNPVYLDQGLVPLAGLNINLDDYVTDLQTFIGIPLALEVNGPSAAFADRSGGNLSRPFYPDGISAASHGPFSKPGGQWSVFSSGLQLDLVYNALIHHVGFVAGVLGADVPRICTGNRGFVPAPDSFTQLNPIPALANGMQIFPGSVPIYRGNTLIGGIGVSGDGVDQDDLIAFIGLDRASQLLGGAINNAPPAIRADTIDIPGEVDLRYVNCPPKPFLSGDDFDVCDGK